MNMARILLDFHYGIDLCLYAVLAQFIAFYTVFKVEKLKMVPSGRID